MADTIDEQLTKYLADAHSIEEQALQQLRGAPDAVSDPELAGIFREHLVETEEHERLVRSRLEEHDSDPSRLKDLLMRVGGAGFLLFASAAGHLRQARRARLFVRAPRGRRIRAVAARGRARRRHGNSRDGAKKSRPGGAHGEAARGELRSRGRGIAPGGGPGRPRRAAEQVPRGRPRDRAQAMQLLEKGPRLSGIPTWLASTSSTSKRRTSTSGSSSSGWTPAAGTQPVSKTRRCAPAR